MKTLYEYKAVVRRVYDSTTIVVDIDLGFHKQLKDQYIIFDSIAVPVIPGLEIESKQASIDWLNDKLIYKEVLLHTMKDPKHRYNHWNALVYMKGKDDYDREIEICVNDELVKSGYAVYVN